MKTAMNRIWHVKDTLATLISVFVVFFLSLAILTATPCETGGIMTESKPALPKTVGLWTRPESPQHITVETIFDYMNGAGELYLGYRFNNLEAYVYKSPNQKEVLVELYYMKHSDDAFGLLSLDWGGEPVDWSQETGKKSLSSRSHWPRALYGKGLLRLWSDTLYARVMAYQETPDSRDAVLALGRAIISGRKNPRHPELANSLPDVIHPEWALLKDSVSFFRTHLVLNSLYYLGHENMLNLDLASEAVTAVYERKNSAKDRTRFRFIKVNYPDSAQARAALAHFHKSYLPEHSISEKAEASDEIVVTYPVEDGWMGYKVVNKTISFAFECPDQETARAIIHQMK